MKSVITGAGTAQIFKKAKMKKKVLIAAFLLLMCAFVFVSFFQREAKKDFFAMDTVISIKINGLGAKRSAEKIEKEIIRLHGELSVNGNGALAGYNRGEDPGEELSYLLSESERLRKETDGAFDAGIYPVTKLWGFTTGAFSVPDEEDVKRALSLKGIQFDLGAIAKGYGADRVREILSEGEIKSATVTLGGTVLLYGNEEMTVAIASPDGEGYAGYIKAKNSVISTSGGYERYFEENGGKYSHIINPETGYPAKSGIISTTVISESGTKSDAFSTAVFVMGEEKAKELWKKERFGLVLITEDGRMIISEDIYPSVSGINEKYKTEIWYYE